LVLNFLSKPQEATAKKPEQLMLIAS
jgi:hypothetical protein